LETTQGPYDREDFGFEKTIHPMNVDAEYWKDLGFSREDLRDPEKNIQAGVKFLKRIQDRMPNASVAKVATIYNNLGARKVSDYGARVEQILKEKPWKKR
jgi:Transglycosylase SLT domain